MAELDLPLDEAGADPDPLIQFERWFAEAREAEASLPNAMALASSSRAGAPSVRMVLLNGFDARGFVFFTNLESSKAGDLAANPRAALAFHWARLHRQVRIAGSVTQTSRADSEAYWSSRPYGSRISASASDQSRVIGSRRVLEEAVRRLQQEHPETPPLPTHWGGYRVAAESMEFWQGRPNRLHDRLLYTRLPAGGWRLERLAP